MLSWACQWMTEVRSVKKATASRTASISVTGPQKTTRQATAGSTLHRRSLQTTTKELLLLLLLLEWGFIPPHLSIMSRRTRQFWSHCLSVFRTSMTRRVCSDVSRGEVWGPWSPEFWACRQVAPAFHTLGLSRDIYYGGSCSTIRVN